MPRGVKPSLTDWGHAKAPDFSIPVPAAQHHDAAAKHYEEAARHHRQAAKLLLSGPHEKVSHHAHLAYAHRLHAEQHAEEAAKAHLKNRIDDSHFETTLVERFGKKTGENR
jgi:hypothetical protein